VADAARWAVLRLDRDANGLASRVKPATPLA